MISFIKLPIHVADSNESYHLFDMLIPSEFNEKDNLMIVGLLRKLRPLFANNRNVDTILSSFLDSQPFITFNYIYMYETDARVSENDLEWILVGDKKFSLDMQDESDFYFNCTTSMLITKLIQF